MIHRLTPLSIFLSLPLCLFFCLFTPAFVFASCSITLELPAPGLAAHKVPWSACATSGIGLQAALDAISTAGGGELRLRGPGGLLIDRPLFVPANTSLAGDPSRAHGTPVSGTVNAGRGYRRRPVLVVAGVENVSIRDFEFIAPGDPADHNLHGPAVAVHGAAHVLITRLKAASVQMGIAVKNSSRVTLREIDLEMVRSRHGRPEGGAGIWLRNVSDSIIEYCRVTGTEYFDAGPPGNTDYRQPWRNAAPAMDLVATHGGRDNQIRHNEISRGNAAGIYAACLSGAFTCEPGGYEEGLQVWNNQVRDFRQHGIDIAHALEPLIEGNEVSNAGFALLALGNVHGGSIRHNRLRDGGLDPGGAVYGALHFLWSSSGNRVEDNFIDGGSNHYAVYFMGALGGYGGARGNAVTDNLFRGGFASPFFVAGDLEVNRAFRNERD